MFHRSLASTLALLILACAGPVPPLPAPTPAPMAAPATPDPEPVLELDAFRPHPVVRAADARTTFVIQPDTSRTLRFVVRDTSGGQSAWRWDPADGTVTREPVASVRSCDDPALHFMAVRSCWEVRNPATGEWMRMPPSRRCSSCGDAFVYVLEEEMRFNVDDGGHGAVGTLRMWDPERWTSVVVDTNAYEGAQWSERAGVLVYRVFEAPPTSATESSVRLWHRETGETTNVGDDIGALQLFRDRGSLVYAHHGDVVLYDVRTGGSRVIGTGEGVDLRAAEDPGFVAWRSLVLGSVSGVRLGEDGAPVESFMVHRAPEVIGCLWPDTHGVAFESGRGGWKVRDLRSGRVAALTSEVTVSRGPGPCWPIRRSTTELTVLFPAEADHALPGEPRYRVVDVAGAPLELRRDPTDSAEVVGALDPDEPGVRFLGVVSQQGPIPWWQVEVGAAAGWVDARHLTPR